MPSEKHNSITAKAMGSIFLLFNVSEDEWDTKEGPGKSIRSVL